MFFSFSRPNGAVLTVRLSTTQSDNNELSAAAARNCCCKTKVWGCVWGVKGGYPAGGYKTQPLVHAFF